MDDEHELGHMPLSIQEEYRKEKLIFFAKICTHFVNGQKCLIEARSGYCPYGHDERVREAFQGCYNRMTTSDEIRAILTNDDPMESVLI